MASGKPAKKKKSGASAKKSRGRNKKTRRSGSWILGVLGSTGKLIGCLAFTGLVAAAVGVAVFVGLLSTYTNELPDISDINLLAPSETTQIYDSQARELARLFIENRLVIEDIEEIPLKLRQAFLAIEDKKFYDHHGVNPRRVVGTLIEHIRDRDAAGGASTISMQLAKLMFLTPEKTAHRKVLQTMLAMELERKYTKDQILLSYLNLIYFGHGAHGVAAAARVYFNKTLEELNPAECAFLAGLPQRPSFFARNPEAARHRRNVVLGEMYSMGYITREELEEYRDYPPPALENIASNIESSDFQSFSAPYFTTYVVDALMGRYGADIVYRHGFQIETTLDYELQLYAEEAAAWGVTRAVLGNKDVSQAALVVIDVNTGFIKAMVGGVDFSEAEFNRAWQARRQPGSSFKPFVYLTAIERGLSMSAVRKDTEVAYEIHGQSKPYVPHNFGRRFSDEWLSLRDALRRSINTVAVMIINEVGPSKVVQVANRAGIKSELDPQRLGDGYLALGLGTSEVSPLEMAAAYATFASGGVYREPTAILSIRRRDGSSVDYHRPRERRVFEHRHVYILTHCLRSVVQAGTGVSAREGLGKYSIAGKTGTTDDHGDAWFVGYTPNVSVVVWLGNDNRQTAMRQRAGLLFEKIDWLQGFLFRFVRGEAARAPVSSQVEIIVSALADHSGETWAAEGLAAVENWRDSPLIQDDVEYVKAGLDMLFTLQDINDHIKDKSLGDPDSRSAIQGALAEMFARMWSYRTAYAVSRIKANNITSFDGLRSWRGAVQQLIKSESDATLKRYYQALDETVGVILAEISYSKPITGGSYPARIWNYFMRLALRGVEPVEFAKPAAAVTQYDLGLEPVYPEEEPEPEPEFEPWGAPGLGAGSTDAIPFSPPPSPLDFSN